MIGCLVSWRAELVAALADVEDRKAELCEALRQALVGVVIAEGAAMNERTDMRPIMAHQPSCPMDFAGDCEGASCRCRAGWPRKVCRLCGTCWTKRHNCGRWAKKDGVDGVCR